MATKVTKGQISDGTISKNTCFEEYYLCGKFHGFMKKCTIFWLCRYIGAVLEFRFTIYRAEIYHDITIYRGY